MNVLLATIITINRLRLTIVNAYISLLSHNDNNISLATTAFFRIKRYYFHYNNAATFSNFPSTNKNTIPDWFYFGNRPTISLTGLTYCNKINYLLDERGAVSYTHLPILSRHYVCTVETV